MRAMGRGSGRYVAMTARVSYRWVNFRTISARRFDILLRPVNVSRIAAPQSLPAHQYTQSNLTMDRVTAAQYRATGAWIEVNGGPIALYWAAVDLDPGSGRDDARTASVD